MKTKLNIQPRRLAAVAGLLAITGLSGLAIAADHTDSPAAAADPAVDIADFYAWHTDDKLVAVVTFAGLSDAGAPATYDAETVYGIHIDTDDDNEPDQSIWVKFGQNGAGDWGVQAMGIPGEDDAVVGEVATNIEGAGGSLVFAGLREDPFFFDFEGFGDTLETGTLSFDAERDSFAGTNVTAIVIEMDRAAAAGDSESLSMWATAGRK